MHDVSETALRLGSARGRCRLHYKVFAVSWRPFMPVFNPCHATIWPKISIYKTIPKCIIVWTTMKKYRERLVTSSRSIRRKDMPLSSLRFSR